MSKPSDVSSRPPASGRASKISFALNAKPASQATTPKPNLSGVPLTHAPTVRPANPSRPKNGRASAPSKSAGASLFGHNPDTKSRPSSSTAMSDRPLRDRIQLPEDQQVSPQKRDSKPPSEPLPPPSEPRQQQQQQHQQHQQRPTSSHTQPHTQPPKRQRPKRHRLTRRPKQCPIIEEGFRSSNSVYFRKPGNESVIGAGTYGKVFKAIHVYTNQMVALKKIKMEGERDGFPVTAIREIKLLQSLEHPNIVELREVMVENNDCFMVFEYLSHDLTGLLNHPSFTLLDSHKKHLAKQFFEGLDYLHHRGVLHRDIKAANILVSKTGQLKLADFGLARFYDKHQSDRRKNDYTNRVITIWYRPPELLLGETKYGPAVDVWSAACVFVEILTRRAIFPGDGSELSQLDKIYSILGTPTVEEWPNLEEMMWYELLQPTERRVSTFADLYQDRISPAAFDLLGAMFAFDPDQRPTASDVLTHPYFLSEHPAAQQPIELQDVDGDWHEFESKALRKERDRKEREQDRERDRDRNQEKGLKRKMSATLSVPPVSTGCGAGINNTLTEGNHSTTGVIGCSSPPPGNSDSGPVTVSVPTPACPALTVGATVVAAPSPISTDTVMKAGEVAIAVTTTATTTIVVGDGGTLDSNCTHENSQIHSAKRRRQENPVIPI